MAHVTRPTGQAVRVHSLAALLAIGPATGVMAATASVTPTPTVAPTTAPSTQRTTSITRAGGARPIPPAGPPGPRGGDSLTHAQTVLNLANADLAAAQGTLDRARQQAGSAIELANVADDLLVRKLGGALPSQQDRPQPPLPPAAATAGSSQARVGRQLAVTYHGIVNVRDALASANLPTPWATILNETDGLYKDAYIAYQNGQYDQAASEARVADHLVHAMAQAIQATTKPDKPVSVPAPSF